MSFSFPDELSIQASGFGPAMSAAIDSTREKALLDLERLPCGVVRRQRSTKETATCPSRRICPTSTKW